MVPSQVPNGVSVFGGVSIGVKGLEIEVQGMEIEVTKSSRTDHRKHKNCSQTTTKIYPPKKRWAGGKRIYFSGGFAINSETFIQKKRRFV